MELKQDDRNLLREFFWNQSDWIEESKISYVVPASHINSLDKSIQQKVGQNEKERRANYETIKNFIVH